MALIWILRELVVGVSGAKCESMIKGELIDDSCMDVKQTLENITIVDFLENDIYM